MSLLSPPAALNLRPRPAPLVKPAHSAPGSAGGEHTRPRAVGDTVGAVPGVALTPRVRKEEGLSADQSEGPFRRRGQGATRSARCVGSAQVTVVV